MRTRRLALVAIVALVAPAAASCTSFGASSSAAAEPDAGPDAGSDSASSVAEGSSSRCVPPFADSFERGALGGVGWDRVPTGSASGVSYVVDPEIHAGAGTGRSLKVVVTPQPDRTDDYFEKLTPVGSCPIQLSFDLRIDKPPSVDDAIAFATVELTGEAAAVFLTLHEEGIDLIEERGGEPRYERITSANVDAWLRVVFRYDPTSTPARVQVAVGSALPVTYETQLGGLGTPTSVRLGSAYSPDGADATFWIDNFALE